MLECIVDIEVDCVHGGHWDCAEAMVRGSLREEGMQIGDNTRRKSLMDNCIPAHSAALRLSVKRVSRRVQVLSMIKEADII